MLLRGAPAGTHTPSLTARPGGSKIASTQRAPAGGYVAISPRQVDVPGTGPGSGRVAVPPDPQHPPRTRVNDSQRGLAAATKPRRLGCAGSPRTDRASQLVDGRDHNRIYRWASRGKDRMSFWIEDSKLRRRVGRGWQGGLRSRRSSCAMREWTSSSPNTRTPSRGLSPALTA